jgi:hypothetical protein
MHRAALQGLKMVGNKLSAKEEEAYRNKGTQKTKITTLSQQSSAQKRKSTI